MLYFTLLVVAVVAGVGVQSTNQVSAYGRSPLSQGEWRSVSEAVLVFVLLVDVGHHCACRTTVSVKSEQREDRNRRACHGKWLHKIGTSTAGWHAKHVATKVTAIPRRSICHTEEAQSDNAPVGGMELLQKMKMAFSEESLMRFLIT